MFKPHQMNCLCDADVFIIPPADVVLSPVLGMGALGAGSCSVG